MPTKIKRSSRKSDAEGSSEEVELQSPDNEDMGGQIKNGVGMTIIKEDGGRPTQQEVLVDQTEETVVPTKIKRTSKKNNVEGSSQDVKLQSPHNEEIWDLIKNGDGTTMMKEHGGKTSN